jgi:dihydroorotate dehydrogenase (NAD+) catalytic subunit
VEHARLAERYGVAGLTAINAVKALRLDPNTGKPYLKNRYGALSGRAIKPIGLRIVSELRETGIRLPIIASAGIRDFDDCREFFWAGADACSLGSAVWLKPMPLYALGPIEGLRIRRLIDRIAAYQVPARAQHPIDFNASPPLARPIEAEPFEAVDTSATAMGHPELAVVH